RDPQVVRRGRHERGVKRPAHLERDHAFGAAHAAPLPGRRHGGGIARNHRLVGGVEIRRHRHEAVAGGLAARGLDLRRWEAQDGRLGVVRGGQLLFRPLEHEPAEAKGEPLVNGVQRLACRRKPLSEVLCHPDFLRALSGAEPNRFARGYHCTTMLAHVKPAPKAQNITFIPGCSRPHRTASSSAMATDAADVLPNRSTFTYTLSIGRPACLAVASMIRMFAWCGISKSMSAPVSPACCSAWSQASAIDSTAALNTSRPAILMKYE